MGAQEDRPGAREVLALIELLKHGQAGGELIGSGVYVIVNRTTGMSYIGKSERMPIRHVAHLSSLKAGTHHCGRLQEDWNATGAGNFAFGVLANCSGDDMARIEERCLAAVPADSSYNRAAWSGGRPATGRTPDKDRTEKSRQALLAAGGRRLDVRLSPEATEALAKIRGAGAYDNDTAALEATLINRARRIKG